MYICKSYDGIYHFKFVLFQNAAYSIANNTEVYIKPDKGNAPRTMPLKQKKIIAILRSIIKTQECKCTGV